MLGGNLSLVTASVEGVVMLWPEAELRQATEHSRFQLPSGMEAMQELMRLRSRDLSNFHANQEHQVGCMYHRLARSGGGWEHGGDACAGITMQQNRSWRWGDEAQGAVRILARCAQLPCRSGAQSDLQARDTLNCSLAPKTHASHSWLLSAVCCLLGRV